MEKIRVLLIKPPSSSNATLNQSLGLAYLAATLEKKKILVKIIDAPVLGYRGKTIIKEARKFQPTVIGLTCLTPEFPSTLKLATSLKKYFPDCLIILGGPHPTVAPKETLKYACFDLVVLGEAEKTFPQLLKVIKQDKNKMEKVKGIAFKKGRKIIITPPQPFVKNLDTFPFPARHLLPPLEKYQPSPGSYRSLPVGIIVTSRGCPFNCTFCNRNVFGNHPRFRSPKNVVDEMEILIKKYGAREIRIWDDTFNLKPERVVAICQEICQRKLKFSWTCQARVNFVDLKTLKWMKKAGCWQISYGIESGNQEILNKIKKGITLEMVRKGVLKTKRAGLEAKGFFMLGLPGETEQTMRETIDFAKKLPLDLAAFSITIPYPGTELYQQGRKSGELKKTSWENFLPYEPGELPFVPKGLTAKKIIAYQKQAYKEFYFRPKILIREFLKIRNLTTLQAKIKGFLSVQTKIPS